MSKSNTFENSLLLLIFNNADIANIGDAGGLRGSVTPGSLYYALHTADPGEAGSAVTNEVTVAEAYIGYARVAAARSAAGFAITDNSVSPAEVVDFPECEGSVGTTITHFSVVNTASGAGIILYSGTVTPNIAIATGVIPRLKITSTITED